MTRQPDLYSPMLGTNRSKQGRLWADGPEESNLSCECGEALVRTPGGYWSCPKGHGKLREAQSGESPPGASWSSGDLFTTDEGE